MNSRKKTKTTNNLDTIVNSVLENLSKFDLKQLNKLADATSFELMDREADDYFEGIEDAEE